MEIVPYIVLLVVPVLGRMSDPSDSIRFMATQCFATLIRLLPLEVGEASARHGGALTLAAPRLTEVLTLSRLSQAGIPDPPAMSAQLIRQKARERHFLEQLLDGKKLENYKIPVPIKAELRKYQQVRSPARRSATLASGLSWIGGQMLVCLQDGVNWLSFLNKYKLHGILCDDMGLGKTLQSICILAGDHYLRYRVGPSSGAACLFATSRYALSFACISRSTVVSSSLWENHRVLLGKSPNS